MSDADDKNEIVDIDQDLAAEIEASLFGAADGDVVVDEVVDSGKVRSKPESINADLLADADLSDDDTAAVESAAAERRRAPRERVIETEAAPAKEATVVAADGLLEWETLIRTNEDGAEVPANVDETAEADIPGKMPASAVKQIVQGVVGSTRLPSRFVNVLQYASFLYVNAIAEESHAVMRERNHYGPIRPQHIREAQRRLVQRGALRLLPQKPVRVASTKRIFR